ncbi:unnamed protein product [Callosobruchus maculatus]|uniref:Endonuclease/exonuclease/phosphatase domain-containing protein n=1 Tax=Callosobruchus maculatus TaxID=64391 RepID=A0A653CQH2_CALMS|nr:unnamed protein product [Callosobruchus maculatus]
MTRPNQHNSPVDITLVSRGIEAGSKWEVSRDPGNSDHFPIICEIETTIHTYSIKHTRNFRRANWQDYQYHIDKAIQEDLGPFSPPRQLLGFCVNVPPLPGYEKSLYLLCCDV